jgi:hypothetical protein
MANITRAPFYVPRHPDDACWSGAPLASGAAIVTRTQVRFYGQPGQVPTKCWNPVYTFDDASAWQFVAPHNAILAPVIKPSVPKIWNVNYVDHHTVWNGGPTNIDLLFPLLTAAGQVKSNQWLWGYNDASVWSGGPTNIDLLFPLLTAAGQVPTKRWNLSYTFDDASAWQFTASHNANLSVVNKPSVPKLWNVNYVDHYTVWNGSPAGSDLLFPLLTSVGQVKPRQWLWGLDDASAWQFTTLHNANLSAVVQKPLVSTFWNYADDASAWQFTASHNANLSTVVQEPLVSTFWNYADDAALWTGTPTASDLLFPLLTAAGQVRSKQWLWGHDDPAVWNTQPRPMSSLQFNLTVSGQLHTKQWHYDIDDATLWFGRPLPVSDLQLNLTAGGQLRTRQWHYDIDDASTWQWSPLRSWLMPELTQQKLYGAGGQAVTKNWTSTHTIDDSSVWWNWTNKNSAIGLIVGKPLSLPAQQFVISSEEPWTLTWQRNVNTISIVLPPFKARVPRPDPDDIALWSYQFGKNVAGTVVVPAPFTADPARFDFDDAAIWQWRFGYPISPAPPVIRNKQTSFNFDETSVWSYRLGKNIATAIITLPFLTRSTRFDFDETAIWQWRFSRPIVPTSFTIRASFALARSYDDSMPWAGSFRSVSPLALRKSPLASLTWRFGLPEELFWRPSYPSLVKFIPPVSSFPFVSGKWGQDIPQDTPPLMYSRAAALLYIPLLLFKRIANAISEIRAADARPRASVVDAPIENRTSDATTRTSIADAPGENRVGNAPKEDT